MTPENTAALLLLIPVECRAHISAAGQYGSAQSIVEESVKRLAERLALCLAALKPFATYAYQHPEIVAGSGIYHKAVAAFYGKPLDGLTDQPAQV